MKLLSHNITQIKHILWIYLMAFALMVFSFNADAKTAKKESASKSPIVVINVEIQGKSIGNIEVKLNAEKAPLSTENFLKYVDDKFYDGTIFHRVIPNFMIQGGGMTPGMKEKTARPSIKNEAKNGLSNKRGAIAMARTNEVDSATSQFFIDVADRKDLDYTSDESYGYAVFGEVTKGMDVVDKIVAVERTTKGGHQDVPVADVIIKSVKRK